MSDLNEIILAAARAEIGTYEWAKGSNPKVVAYYADAGHPEIKDDATPWCAAFVGAILGKVGLLGTGSLMARSYEKWGEPVAANDIRPGDVGVMPRGDKGWQGHVFFVERIDYDSGMVYALGGNQRDAVNVEQFRLSPNMKFRRATAPRQNVAESTTIKASSVISVASAATPIVAAIGGVPWQNLAVICALGVLVLLASGYITSERLKKWRQGVR